MQLCSMTGFARVEGDWENHRWTWELKSVNSRGLDIRHRLPSGMDAFERTLKRLVSDQLSRGNVNCNLAIETVTEPQLVQINEAVLNDAIKHAKAAAEKHGLEAPRIGEIMALRGVIDVVTQSIDDDERAARDEAILTSLEQAVCALAADRAEEGQKLALIIGDQITQIENLLTQARDGTAGQISAIQEKLEARLSDLFGSRSIDVDENRLIQETALLALKADVTEELDRLDAHVSAARDLLAAGSPAGRKLDFLAQEFGREANTLASKAANNELSSIGLDLKVIIDQMREQVQNIE